MSCERSTPRENLSNADRDIISQYPQYARRGIIHLYGERRSDILKEMKEDVILNKLGEHDQRFDTLVTKTEFNDFKDRVLSTQDNIITILRRLDEERVFSTKWVEQMETEIQKIKTHLKI